VKAELKPGAEKLESLLRGIREKIKNVTRKHSGEIKFNLVDDLEQGVGTPKRGMLKPLSPDRRTLETI
jgi:hypothetical protein